MKRFLVLILLVAIIASVINYRRNTDVRRAVSRFSSRELESADALRYRLYVFGILGVGEAVFYRAEKKEFRGGPVYHLRAVAQSAPELEWFYVASMAIDSFVDTASGTPLVYREKLRVKGKIEDEKEVVYDQANHTMTIGEETRQILPDTHDPLSAIFSLRKMDIPAEPQEIELSINTNQKNYVLQGTVTARDELINRKARPVTLVKASIRRRDKNPYHKSRIQMVLTGGRENIPVLIKVFAGGFFVSARLIEVQ
ncbi:MAG: DUF3108 domain-containing protein [Candidatus Omnitrophica bacterium]|nr:DUF3108 domain-containing protein [Candidatus Omnitrophota bacterium]